MSKADVWGTFECMEEVVEDFMHQAGALQGLLQEALAGRQDLCDAEGGSKGWSGAEVLFLFRGGFRAGGRGRHQELEQGRGQTAGPCRGALHAGGRFLEGLFA